MQYFSYGWKGKLERVDPLKTSLSLDFLIYPREFEFISSSEEFSQRIRTSEIVGKIVFRSENFYSFTAISF